MKKQFTTQDVAEMLGLAGAWPIQRIFALGDLPEPPRFAGKRMIAGETLPAIVDALRRRGWLPERDQAPGEASAQCDEEQHESRAGSVSTVDGGEGHRHRRLA